MVVNGRDLLAEAARLQPDVIILDIAMPILNGIEAARRLHDSLPTAKVLFVTQQTDRHYCRPRLAPAPTDTCSSSEPPVRFARR